GFVGWRALQDTQNQETPAETAVIGGDQEAATGPAGAAAQRHIEIRAVAESWLEVRGPDGTVFLSRTMKPGESYSPDPSPGWTLHARDGGAFQLFVDGESAGPLGSAGLPVLGRQIDSIEALPQPALSAVRPTTSAVAPVRAVSTAPAAPALPDPGQPADQTAPAPSAPEPAAQTAG
ncbi:MAG: DUF4115 domain-containing protein, partial [Caulobacterales bacterium]